MTLDENDFLGPIKIENLLEHIKLAKQLEWVTRANGAAGPNIRPTSILRERVITRKSPF